MIEQAYAEVAKLVSDTSVFGARRTARRELRREREYVQGGDSPLRTLMRAGQTSGQLVAVMLTITVAAAIGFVGTAVISDMQESITDKNLNSTDAANQTLYENTTESIGGGFADAMGLTDIVFLVLMFGVILGALLAFRSR